MHTVIEPDNKPITQNGALFWIGGLCVLAVSLFARAISYTVQTTDYQYFVSNWFTALSTGHGLSAFANPFADYAPLYLYLLKLLTFIPLQSLYSSKTLSFLFDLIIAGISALLLEYVAPARFGTAKMFFAFAVMLSIPTVILNSSLWGQSDALYAAGVIASLYFIFRDKPLAAVTAFGVAISFKLQAIFFLPVLMGYLFQKGKRAWTLLLVPVMFVISVVPALLGGGSFSYWGLIYIKQSGEYTALNESSASVFAFMQNVSNTLQGRLSVTGVVCAAIVALFVIVTMIDAKKGQTQKIFLTSIASVLLIPYLLPHMHERYFYLADVLSALYALYNPRHWYMPALIVAGSFFSYMPYLSNAVPLFAHLELDLRLASAMYALAAGLVVTFVLRQERTLHVQDPVPHIRERPRGEIIARNRM